MNDPNHKVTATGNICNPLHSNCDGTVVKVEAPMRSDTYLVSEARNKASGDWWVYFLRPTGWVCVAGLREGDHVPAGATPEDIVRHVDKTLLNR